MNMYKSYMKLQVVNDMADAKPVGWVNPKKISFAEAVLPVSANEIAEASERLKKFAPFVKKCFSETVENDGLIESNLVSIPNMQKWMEEAYQISIPGQMLLKQDSELPVAGSVKARGGIYEVLKHTEDLALEAGILKENDDYYLLADPKCREFFSQYTIQVGSTGNLGLSIGITSAAIGYKVVVHMSADAKQWKKDLLRSHGVTVKEYDSDYSEAVKHGRMLSDADPKSYFVDDENSVNLFMGYAVAAERMKKQMDEQGFVVDADHPLFVYIPCGVGGAPGGVTFGLKNVWGDHVHVFFVEPTQAPAMILGMATGLHSDICAQDIGLSGFTEADGLAVSRPSGFVGKIMEPLLSGEFTMEDKWLCEYMRGLWKTESIFVEPSAAAAFEGPVKLLQYEETKKYIEENGLEDKMANAIHVVWATGGRLVPESVKKCQLQT